MEVQEENILELLSGGQELFYASDAAKADASDVAASTSQPKTPHDRRPTSDDDGDYDMDRLIEQDLAHANAALGRQLHRATAGATASDMDEGSSSAAELAPQPSDADSQREQQRPRLSEARRREILAKLAIERSERRGFASDREITLAQAMADSAAAAAETARPTLSSPSSTRSPSQPLSLTMPMSAEAQPGSSNSLETSLQAAASHAISRALAHLGVHMAAERVDDGSSPVSDAAAAAAPTTIPPARASGSSSSSSRFNRPVASAVIASTSTSPVPAARRRPAPASSSIAAAAPSFDATVSGSSRPVITSSASTAVASPSSRKASRDALVARLLAEREMGKRKQATASVNKQQQERGAQTEPPAAAESVAPETSAPTATAPEDQAALLASLRAQVAARLGSSAGGGSPSISASNGVQPPAVSQVAEAVTMAEVATPRSIDAAVGPVALGLRSPATAASAANSVTGDSEPRTIERRQAIAASVVEKERHALSSSPSIAGSTRPPPRLFSAAAAARRASSSGASIVPPSSSRQIAAPSSNLPSTQSKQVIAVSTAGAANTNSTSRSALRHTQQQREGFAAVEVPHDPELEDQQQHRIVHAGDQRRSPPSQSSPSIARAAAPSASAGSAAAQQRRASLFGSPASVSGGGGPPPSLAAAATTSRTASAAAIGSRRFVSSRLTKPTTSSQSRSMSPAKMTTQQAGACVRQRSASASGATRATTAAGRHASADADAAGAHADVAPWAPASAPASTSATATRRVSSYAAVAPAAAAATAVPSTASAAHIDHLAQSKAGWRRQQEAARRAREEAELAAACTFQPNADRPRRRSKSHDGGSRSVSSSGRYAAASLAAGQLQQAYALQQQQQQAAVERMEDAYLSWDGSMGLAQAYLETPPLQTAAAVAAAAAANKRRPTAAASSSLHTQRHARVGGSGPQSGQWVPLLPGQLQQQRQQALLPQTAPARLAQQWQQPAAPLEPQWQSPASDAAYTAPSSAVGPSLIPVLVPRWSTGSSSEAPTQPAQQQQQQQQQPPPKASTSATQPPPSSPPSSSVAERLYAEAQVRALAKAKRKAQLEQERLAPCTFQPRINPTSDRIATGGGGGGFGSSDALSPSAAAVAAAVGPGRVPLHKRTSAIQQARARSLARARMEAVLSHPDLTFQPRISEASARLAAAKARAEGLPIAAAVGPVEGGDAASEQHQQRASRRASTVSGSAAAAYALREGEIDLTSFYQQQQQQQQQQHEKEEVEHGDQHPPSQPATLPPSVAATRRLSKYAQQLQLKKAARQAAAAAEEAARCTFQPRISATSEKLAAARLAALGVSLGGSSAGGVAAEDGGGGYDDDVTAAGGTARGSGDRRASSVGGGSVSPRSVTGSLAAGGSSVSPSAPGQPSISNFLARQRVMSQLTEAERRRIAAQAAAQAKATCTFTPDIGNAEEVLALTRPQLVLESDAARVQRLSQADAAAVAAARKAVQDGYYSQFTFQPAIDPVSRLVGRAHTPAEHHRNEAGAAARARAAAQAEAEFSERHPFKPTLVAADPNSRQRGRSASSRRGSKAGDDAQDSDVTSPAAGGADVSTATGTTVNPYRLAVASDPSGVSERIAALQRAKAEHVERLRRQMEYEQLKECTFAPETNGGRVPLTSAHAPSVAAEAAVNLLAGEASPGASAPAMSAAVAAPPVVVVRGLGRFLELKELSRRLEEEQREREAAAFAVKLPEPLVDPHTGKPLPRGPTIPVPFKLATDAIHEAVAGNADYENIAARDGSTSRGASSSSSAYPSLAAASASAVVARPVTAEKHRRVAAEAYSAALGECTFQPNANGSGSTHAQRLSSLVVPAY